MSPVGWQPRTRVRPREMDSEPYSVSQLCLDFKLVDFTCLLPSEHEAHSIYTSSGPNQGFPLRWHAFLADTDNLEDL